VGDKIFAIARAKFAKKPPARIAGGVFRKAGIQEEWHDERDKVFCNERTPPQALNLTRNFPAGNPQRESPRRKPGNALLAIRSFPRYACLMAITQTVEAQDDRRLAIDAPGEAPAGSVTLAFAPAAGNGCPLCAGYRDPQTGEPRFNAETIAAFEEGDAMLRGEILAKRFGSFEEMMTDLDSDD